MKNKLPELDQHEKLILRCYLKNIITTTSLTNRLAHIAISTDKEILKKISIS